MKKRILFFSFLALSLNGWSQLLIEAGAKWQNEGSVIVTLKNTDFVNHGSFTPGNSNFKFSGDQHTSIGGTVTPMFYTLEIGKSNNKEVQLNRTISVSSLVNFNSGLLNLNNNIMTLSPTALFAGESESNRMIGPSGGYAEIIVPLNSPSSSNPGNLGAILTSTADLGTVTIRRGHTPRSGNGLLNSITRYFSITPSNNSNLNATLRFTYFDAELNNFPEASLSLFKSEDNGTSWSNQSVTSANTAANYLEKTAINNFSLWTASIASGVLPVTGLEFYAKRISPTQVQLDWKTIQEINNKGFHIERRRENENNFVDIGFVNSLAANGNSTIPLQYQKTDNNNFADKTQYRLKQEDTDGKFTYSVIRIVNGVNTKQTVLQVWPIPAAGPVNVLVSGIEKADNLMVFDMSGKLVQQMKVQNNTQVLLTKLIPGAYIIRLLENKDLVQKIIIQ